MEKVYTSKLNAVGIGEWTLEDVLKSYKKARNQNINKAR